MDGVLFFALSHFFAGFVGATMNDPVEACYKEPVRLVQRAGESYSFNVAGCEYQANKDKLIVLK